METLYFIAKALVSTIFIVASLILLFLACKSHTMLKTLVELEDSARHSLRAFLTRSSLILTAILGFVATNSSKANIWSFLINQSPLAKHSKFIRFINPLTLLLESIIEFINIQNKNSKTNN